MITVVDMVTNKSHDVALHTHDSHSKESGLHTHTIYINYSLALAKWLANNKNGTKMSTEEKTSIAMD